MKLGNRIGLGAIGIVCLAYATAAASSYFFADDQQADPVPILSTAEGALSPPETWTCDAYVDEYRAWIDDGNAPADWRFAGKRYMDVATNSIYTWDDWIDQRYEQCLKQADYVDPESGRVVPSSTGLIGGIVGAAGATGLASGAGGGSGGADSPG